MDGIENPRAQRVQARYDKQKALIAQISTNCSGWIVINPRDPANYGHVQVARQSDHRGEVTRLVARLPGGALFSEALVGVDPDADLACIANATFTSVEGQPGVITESESWIAQLQKAGFIVAQAV